MSIGIVTHDAASINVTGERAAESLNKKMFDNILDGSTDTFLFA